MRFDLRLHYIGQHASSIKPKTKPLKYFVKFLPNFLFIKIGQQRLNKLISELLKFKSTSLPKTYLYFSSTAFFGVVNLYVKRRIQVK